MLSWFILIFLCYSHLHTAYVGASFLWNGFAKICILRQNSVLMPNHEVPDEFLPSIQRRHNPALFNQGLALEGLVIFVYFSAINFCWEFFDISNTPYNRISIIAAFNVVMTIFGPCHLIVSKPSIKTHLTRCLSEMLPWLKNSDEVFTINLNRV